MLKTFAEADTRVDHQTIFGNTGRQACLHTLEQEVAHFRNDVTIARIGLHRSRLTLHVHQTDGRLRLGSSLDCARLPQRTYVVDHAGAGANSSGHHGGFAGVDRERSLRAGCERLDDGHYAADFFFGIDTLRPRPRRLAADVDQAGALLDHAQRMRDGRFAVCEAAAIREGIGRDIEHAHDSGNGEVERQC